jgi:hypothetical protein
MIPRSATRKESRSRGSVGLPGRVAGQQLQTQRRTMCCDKD